MNSCEERKRRQAAAGLSALDFPFRQNRQANKGFFHRVYDLVAQIPLGKVTTYGEVAAMLGSPRSARMVGWAMRAAPAELELPCHRVIRRDGELSPPDVFGPGVQRERLEREGVTFREDGRVDLRRHLW